MAFGLAALLFQEEIANVGAGDIKVGANSLENARAPEELVADGVVGFLDLLEGLQTAVAGIPQKD